MKSTRWMVLGCLVGLACADRTVVGEDHGDAEEDEGGDSEAPGEETPVADGNDDGTMKTDPYGDCRGLLFAACDEPEPPACDEFVNLWAYPDSTRPACTCLHRCDNDSDCPSPIQDVAARPSCAGAPRGVCVLGCDAMSDCPDGMWCVPTDNTGIIASGYDGSVCEWAADSC